MAWLGTNDLDTVANCGGEQRVPVGHRGTGIVAGTTSIGGVAAPCRVSLHAEDDTLLSYVRTGATGVYSFIGLSAGAYYLVMRDESTLYRAKVEHVVIP